jgi:hypothetical protein
MSAERDDQRDAVDALIDEAARSLTQAEPPMALRARVRSSIASGRRGRPWAWQPALVGAAAAVVATVVVWQMRDMNETPAPPSIPQGVERAPDGPRKEPSATALREAELPRSVETVARREPAALVQASPVAFRGPVNPAAEPLPAIEPIEIEPVESSAMAAIERMPAPMPVAIERLEIERLFE